MEREKRINFLDILTFPQLNETGNYEKEMKKLSLEINTFANARCIGT